MSNDNDGEEEHQELRRQDLPSSPFHEEDESLIPTAPPPIDNEQQVEQVVVEQEEGNNNNKKVVSAQEILYGVESFYVIVQPVLVCMVLSALAVVLVNTPETVEQGTAAISGSYNVRGNAEYAGSSAGAQLGAGLINAIVIVVAIAAMTFLMVVLYYFRCMKILVGYLVLASMMLLCYISSVMFNVAVQKYNLRIDKVSFWLLVYNFGVVGTASIFFQKGFPSYITQAYLILTSVIVAWQLSFFDPWTAWTLLIMLALYDLFAVLTPCGPLKALVNLMSRDGAPEMPGLLYEANLPAGGRQSRHNNNNNAVSAAGGGGATADSNSRATTRRRDNDDQQIDDSSEQQPVSGNFPADEENEARQMVDDDREGGRARTDNNNSRGDHDKDEYNETFSTVLIDESDNTNDDANNVEDNNFDTIEVVRGAEAPAGGEAPGVIGDAAAIDAEAQTPLQRPVRAAAARITGHIPMALARVYKLPLVDNNPRSSSTDEQQQAQDDDDDDDDEENLSAEELRRIVHVVFPRGGGRIQPRALQHDGDEETRYEVIDRHGTVRRTLFVNDEGRVFNDLRDQNAANANGEEKGRNNIRLGLGDFIFYSILVSEAAVYSFTTFAACTLVILVGLLLTLMILAVRGKALPALPISIFLGVICYLLTRYLIQDWIQFIFIQQAYV